MKTKLQVMERDAVNTLSALITYYFQSQRAVKTKLQVMERDAVKKKEKQKEAHAKLEKQQVKDREKLLKAQQRKEVIVC